MIVLFNPRATNPRNRRFPLSIMSLAAVLEGHEQYVIVDGNVQNDAVERILRLIENGDVELIGVTVMPGPQMASAVEACKTIRRAHPKVPIVWGGYFPSIYKDQFGLHRHNGERQMKPPDDFPWVPYHRVDVSDYLRPSFFGARTAAHHASIGCPFKCSFCGVHAAYGNREKIESPARTEAVLTHLKEKYGADSVQFYDMNFFLREDHARELADRMVPLGMRWWCEARIDIVNSYSDATLDALRRAGCAMIFFGAESGSDWVLKEMEKGITTSETIELAQRIRRFGIIPEFSFVIGNPRDPEGDTAATLDFIRKIKRLNPNSEIIMYHYTPVPQRESMYGNVDEQIAFPSTPDEWATKKWMDFTLRIDPQTPWLTKSTKHLIDNFEVVVSSRWPTVQDIRAPKWSRALLKSLSSWRYLTGVYAWPQELRLAHEFINLRKPKRESL